LAGTVSSRASLTADLARQGPRIESQVPGAAAYSHCRPSADFGERQVYGNPATLLLLEAGFVTQAMRNEKTRVAQASAARRAADKRAWLALDWASHAGQRPDGVPGPGRRADSLCVGFVEDFTD
jgi:hypothetical protein